MSGRNLPALLTIIAVTAMTGPVAAQTRPMFVAPSVTFPTTGGVVRAGQNGLVIDEGVASVDESDQYSLLALSIDPPDDVIRFTYGDAWTLTEPRPSSCVFTFRRVERTLTQAAANDLAVTLAGIELQRLKEAHPLLTTTGDTETSGTVVKQRIDRFTWTEDEKTAPAADSADATAEPKATAATVFGLSKTWLFVLSGKAYYANKTCFSWGTAAELTVIDQLIGLDYHRDPVS
ncbi:hypothetical protein BH10PSE1_BH10PSE1_02470 [soil metagenome]